MNKRHLALLMPYMMIMANTERPVNWDLSNDSSRKKEIKNSDQKCYTKGCYNKRSGKHLFCSVECRKVHLAGKVKHQPAIFPQKSQEQIRKDLEELHLDSNTRFKMEEACIEKFGYKIIYWQHNVIIHS